MFATEQFSQPTFCPWYFKGLTASSFSLSVSLSVEANISCLKTLCVYIVIIQSLRQKPHSETFENKLCFTQHFKEVPLSAGLDLFLQEWKHYFYHRLVYANCSFLTRIHELFLSFFLSVQNIDSISTFPLVFEVWRWCSRVQFSFVHLVCCSLSFSASNSAIISSIFSAPFNLFSF